MAVRRFRKYGKKRRGLRRRTTRRTGRVSRPLVSRNIHYFSRYGFYGQATMSLPAVTGQYFGVCFARGLTDIYADPVAGIVMPSSSEFTTLFDQYKILSYTVEFHPRYNGTDFAYTPNNGIPTIYWIYDQDDVALLTQAALMEHQYVRSARLTKPIRITVKYPCVAAEVYQSAVTTGYQTRKAPWIDCNSSTVPHYGIKYMVQGQPNSSVIMDIRVKWRLALKNPR